MIFPNLNGRFKAKLILGEYKNWFSKLDFSALVPIEILPKFFFLITRLKNAELYLELLLEEEKAPNQTSETSNEGTKI